MFLAGCRHHCPGCFNPEAWDFGAGVPFSEVEDEILASMEPPYVDGVSILGGEPLEPENQEELAGFLERCKERFPDKDVWLWTGFVLDDLIGSRAQTEHLERVLSFVDVIVDGPFVESRKDLTLRFRGSANQRVIDLRKTGETRDVTLWSDGPVMSSHRWDA